MINEIDNAKLIFEDWKQQEIKPTTRENAKFIARRCELANILCTVAYEPEDDAIRQAHSRISNLFTDLEDCGKHQHFYQELVDKL